jgi:hypothetical protein
MPIAEIDADRAIPHFPYHESAWITGKVIMEYLTARERDQYHIRP